MSSPPVCNMNACNHLVRFRVPPLSKRYTGFISGSFSTYSISLSHSSPIILFTPPKSDASARCTSSEAPQRSEEWFALRKDKLTTSTFSTAIGFWKADRRVQLWHEKVFASNAVVFESAAKAAMDWGIVHEFGAIEQYKRITGREVGTLGFAVHADEKHGWLGASPDGILGHPDGGILEVKCPYNKGKPELALPWKSVPYYYMPQIQGLMEIMDRDWVDLYCWTLNGSTLFRVFRDREYWRVMHEVLHNFWWDSVVPARDAISNGREHEADSYKPMPTHELTRVVFGKSCELASKSKLVCREIGGINLEFYS